jgi:DNA-binding beta-propeller fold protein YncE
MLVEPHKMSVLHYGRSFIGAGAAVAIVAGCGPSEFAAPPGASPAHRARPDLPKNLYVANFANDTVTVYEPGTGTPLRTISSGVKAPVALAFDPSEYLYVANSATSTVTVYYPESTKPTRTISDEVTKPQAIAFDSKGNTYVMNSGNSTVTVYKAGTTS